MGNTPNQHQSDADAGRVWGKDPLPDYVREHKGKRVIRKILIANNGMAATKAIISMRKWTFEEFGSEKVLTFIAMATKDDLDAHAEFIRLADSFVEVPSGKNVNNYANVELICKVAKEKQVDAVWPGWGHASENPALPSRLTQLGITFIGPTSSVMSALGDKIAANILAQTAKVPSIPWSGDGLTTELTAEGTIPDGVFKKACVGTVEEAVRRAQAIGYPVMVKASEGGGGKGIRKAASEAELRTAFVNVQAEVPGSPIFMMQLCSEARHLEVQIVGDEHGNTLALSGRDCSTQRRFQKIFEEGPPVIATSATFKEMERAAQRLTALVGYRGAGTVEYLYSAAKDKFYFLELNPRLQVEHPVTEGITGVNLPATQLQVAMGIPLYCIPDIRRFYGLEAADITPIDFMATDYPPIRSHVMASRITAENPDEGFKPTSGKIRSIRFQSSTDCWGYFSVGLNGGVHEFADSQFGHVFARGANRNAARRTLLFALKNMDISGDIRHPVPYLVDLLQTEAFVGNTIDTMWLDRLIAAKLIAPSQSALDVVFFAAVYRAHQLVKKRTQDLLSSMQKGQLVLLGRSDTNALVSFPLEIVYDGRKFAFQVLRSREDTYIFSIGSSRVKAKVREQPDGSLYASVGSSTQMLKGVEEALGLRLVIGAATVMLPTVCDPSELRSDVNGKVVRYLHEEGTEVAKGEPYVELEAMKMIMPLKSSEAGRISHAKSAGSIVAAGELLAKLQLKDPSRVQRIEPFEGLFSCCGDRASPEEEPVEEDLRAYLDGYEVGSTGPPLVEKLFGTFASSQASAKSVRGLLDQYLAAERPFAASILSKQPYDQLLQQLISEQKGKLERVVSMMVAHNKLPERHETVLAVLREMVAAEGSGMSCMYVPDIGTEQDMDAGVRSKVTELSKMPGDSGPAGDFGGVRHLAQQLLHVVPHESHEERAERFRRQLQEVDERTLVADGQELGALPDGGLDLELMVELLSDREPTLQQRAIKAYLHWLCAPSHITKVEVSSWGGKPRATWTQQYPTSDGEAYDRQGVMLLLPDLAALESALTTETLGHLTKQTGSSDPPLNLVHLVIGRDAFPGLKDRTRFYNSDDSMTKIVQQCAEVLAGRAEVLRAARVGEVCVALPQPPRHPRFAMFAPSLETEEWAEQGVGRDMWPSFVNLLELPRLAGAYALQRIHKEVRPTSHIYLATSPAIDGHRQPPPELLMRSLHYARAESAEKFVDSLAESLLTAMEELEHARLDPRVARHGPTVTGRIFLHMVPTLPEAMEADDVMQRFKEAINTHVSQHGSQMLKLCVDEIEVKVRRRLRGAPQGGGAAAAQVDTLRLSSSSLRGGYMKMRLLHERPDPVTGGPEDWRKPGSGEQARASYHKSLSMGSALGRTAASQIQAKRVAARRAGSTYAYDLPGLLKVALTAKWASAEGGASPRSGSGLSPPAGQQRANPAARGTLLGAAGGDPGAKKAQVGAWAAKAMPDALLSGRELVLRSDSDVLQESDRQEGTNDIGMVAWRITMRTPEYPGGRDIVLIANDVTFQAGSFGVKEDRFFQLASEYARARGIPRIYVSCNSGARVGLVEELKPLYKVKWIDPADPGKGFDYIYLTEDDYKKLGAGVVEASLVTDGGERRYVINAIIGKNLPSTADGIGVENLQGSGLIAGETSRAYRETFTLSYITGRSVGIGAYLNRLGQRNIQMVSSPMILTGYSALNKLLGRSVYSSQDQLGGPQVMVPNGVTHQVVSDDQEGMAAILDWLSYVPKDVDSIPPICQLSGDNWDRDVEFVPPKQPYDPRDFLRGAVAADGSCLRGFFDAGSFREYLEGWGRTVVVGRARLGGIPMGVIAVETRSVERFVPADPANPASCEVVEPQAGQVWFPDSASKTAQALRDFNRAENLPVMIFANWRGFSGGTRDMYGEILKFGAQIVDALVDYQHPIFVYIPPNGELRGGAWVVIDPKINPEKMEMYADVESRGGILEPPGIVEVKYRAPQQVEAMHRHDDKLAALDARHAAASGAEKERLQKEVKARERQLLPLYTSLAVHFADLHDRAGRMKAVGAIRQAVEWRNSRRFFFWRVKRRVLQDHLVGKLLKADDRLKSGEAAKLIEGWAKDAKVDLNSDKHMASWLEMQDVEERTQSIRTAYIKDKMQALMAELPERERGTLLQRAAVEAARGPKKCCGGAAAAGGGAAVQRGDGCSVM